MLLNNIFILMNGIVTLWPEFFTATNYEWKPLLSEDKYKDIIIDSIRFLVLEKRVSVFAFTLMINHIHLIWQMCADIDPKDVQRDFLKFTAQKIKADLKRNNPDFLEEFRVDAKDREYQFWKRNPLGIELRNHNVFLQKLNYLHENPVRAGICKYPEDYKYSSAYFYETGIDNWGFLTHYKD